MIRLQVYNEAIRRSESGVDSNKRVALVFRNHNEYQRARTEFKSINHPLRENLDHNSAVYLCVNSIYLIDGQTSPFQLNGILHFNSMEHFWLIDLQSEMRFDWLNVIRYTRRSNDVKWTFVQYD